MASGGEATGTGSSSYSVGQVVYTYVSSSNETVSQGVQQPYEISTTLDIDEMAILLEVSVFPNPTSDFIILKIEEKDISKVNYQLYNINGKLLKSEQVENQTTNINMTSYPVATYIVKVLSDNKIVKSFKIIKN